MAKNVILGLFALGEVFAAALPPVTVTAAPPPWFHQAGITTVVGDETWCGVTMVIKGDAIVNANPQTDWFRLTPHILKASGGDYIALVLEATDDVSLT